MEVKGGDDLVNLKSYYNKKAPLKGAFEVSGGFEPP